MKCNFCGQGDIVVMDHDPNDVEYNERLNALFKSWDDVLSYVKYDE